jgi:hypothetical protein
MAPSASGETLPPTARAVPFGARTAKLEATDELAFWLVDIAHKPAAGNLVETINQVESVRAASRPST